jgi:hypothetical protein
MVTKRAIKKGKETKFPHIRHAKIVLPIMNTPPKVGVPFFFLWVSGPSSRMVCPNCFNFMRAIKRFPQTIDTRVARIKAMNDLKVMYLKILKR